MEAKHNNKGIRALAIFVAALMLFASLPAFAGAVPKYTTRLELSTHDVAVIEGKKATFWFKMYGIGKGDTPAIGCSAADKEIFSYTSKGGSKAVVTIKGLKAGTGKLLLQVKTTDPESTVINEYVNITVYPKAAPAPEKIVFEQGAVQLKKGKKLVLDKAKVEPYHPNQKEVTWKSLNPKIASVGAKGKITAKKPGIAVLEGKIKGTDLKVTCTVTVVPKDYVEPVEPETPETPETPDDTVAIPKD